MGNGFANRNRFAAALAALTFCASLPAAQPSAPPPLVHVPDHPPEPEIRVQAVGACDDTDPAQEVVMLVNAERLDNGGLPPLKRVVELDNAALGHSQAMAERDFFAHCDLDTGKSPWVRMTEAGYAWAGAAENLATGYGSSVSVMTGWMASPGHRANILNGTLREIGVGYYLQSTDAAPTRTDQDGNCSADGNLGYATYAYWSQSFGRRNGVFPVVIEGEAAVADSRDVNLYVYGTGWAAEMRLRNDNGDWSPWQPFAAQLSWQLPAEGGDHTVSVQLRHLNGSVASAQDDICLDAPAAQPPPGGSLLMRNGFE